MEKSNFKVSPMAEGLVAPEIIIQAWHINDRIKKGEKIFNLTIGDFAPSVFPIPEGMKEAIIEAYNSKQTNYPPADGLPELRTAISNFIKRKGGFEYGLDEIAIASGTRPIIYSLYTTLIEQGDAVIYPVPSWNSSHYCRLTGAKEIIIPSTPENFFMPVAEDMKPYIKEAKLVSICSPLNPTGTLFSKKQLKDICEMIVAENKRRGNDERPVYLLLDQVYWILTYDGYEHYDPVVLVPEMRDYTIYADGASKAFASTGIRVGFAYGPKKIIEKMRTVISHMGSWAPRPEQTGIAKFLADDKKVDEYLSNFKAELYKRLRFFYDEFTKLNKDGYKVEAIAPQGALYLTVKFDLFGLKTTAGKTIKTSKDINDFLTDEGHVALVPFSSFGSTGDSPWFRLSVGTCTLENAEEVMTLMREALSGLK